MRTFACHCSFFLVSTLKRQPRKLLSCLTPRIKVAGSSMTSANPIPLLYCELQIDIYSFIGDMTKPADIMFTRSHINIEMCSLVCVCFIVLTFAILCFRQLPYNKQPRVSCSMACGSLELQAAARRFQLFEEKHRLTHHYQRSRHSNHTVQHNLNSLTSMQFAPR